MEKVTVMVKNYEGVIEHPELIVTDLGVKSLYTEGRGMPRRIYGRHVTISGPKTMVRSFLDKLAKDHEIFTDL